MKRAIDRLETKMPLYEHIFISRQDLSNTQAEGLVEHFGIVLKDNGGTVVNSEYWGLKTLAYKINKNRNFGPSAQLLLMFSKPFLEFSKFVRRNGR